MQTGVMEHEPLVEPKQFNPEVRRRNDVVTWLAEVLPGHFRNSFEFTAVGNELYASDGGALGDVFDSAIKNADLLPPEQAFEGRRTRTEKGEYIDMKAMLRGELPNTMVVLSDYPDELKNATEDFGGYSAKRKTAMMRVIAADVKRQKITMYSQSLDGSNRKALEEIFEFMGFKAEPGELLGQRMHKDIPEYEQEFLHDQLTGVYDRSLQAQFGGEYYAGRQDHPRINTYSFVEGQTDLINAYLATTDSFKAGKAEYELAAAMKRRFNGVQPPVQLAQSEVTGEVTHTHISVHVAAHAAAIAEMNLAGIEAQQRGEIFSGCGYTISLGNGELTLEAKLGMAGYNRLAGVEPEQSETENKVSDGESDEFGPLNFKCPKGHWNKRPRAKSKDDFLPKCLDCGTSLKC